MNLGAEPKLHLTRYETRRGRIDSDADRLTAYARAIDMIGRKPEMEALLAWLGSARPIAVRVLTGRAGTGKTRLALELVDEASARGWDAGFVDDRELGRFAAQANLAAWGWQNPTLIVVDYAAARAQQLALWLAELADNDSVTPLRLMLLERHADPGSGWWREAFGRGSGDALAILRLLDPAEPVPVPPLGDTEVRRGILAAILAQVGSDLRPPERGVNPDFDGRLTRGEALPAIADEKTALMRASAGDPPEVFAALASALPGEADAIAPVLPDMIGEAVLLRAGIDADAIIRAAASNRPRVAATVMRTAQDYVRQAELTPLDWLDRLVEASVADLAALTEIADALPRDTLVLRTRAAELHAKIVEIVRALPDDGRTGQRRQVLAIALIILANTLSEAGKREEALDIAREAVELQRALAAANPDAFTPDLAVSLNNLAIMLSEAGKREEALDIAVEAASLYRALAAANPGAFTVDLVMSLGIMRLCQSALNRTDEALATIAEALEKLTPHFRALPAAHHPIMAQFVRGYLELAKTLGRNPDATLLEPVVEIFTSLESQGDDDDDDGE